MSDEKGLGGYGIKRLRKSLLMPSPPWARRTFRHWPTKTYPRPSRDAAPQWLVYSLTRRLYAECRNVEVVWMGPVMAVVMAVVLMLGQEVRCGRMRMMTERK